MLTAVLYEEMEVVWPSGVVLWGMAPNRPHLHWLKTAVENVVGKGVTRSRQVGIGKMSDGREPSVVDASKTVEVTSNRVAPRSRDKSGGYPFTVQVVSGA